MHPDSGRKPIDAAFARELRAQLPAAVGVVTTRHGDELHGVTVSALLVASHIPPRVVVCLERPSRSAELVAASGVFAVHALSWSQMFLADRFAGRAPLVDPRFGGVPHRSGVTGAPLLANALAWLECRVVAAWPAGDHVVFLGEVVAAEAADGGDALVHFRRHYDRLPG